MSDRDKRLKAQDLFERRTPVFGGKGTFEEVYPQIDAITVEVQENDLGRDISKRTYAKHNFPGEFINCSNSMCYAGGYHLGSLISSMVREGKTSAEGSAICRGNEGSPKGRRIRRKCLNHFKVNVSIRYKESAPTTPPKP